MISDCRLPTFVLRRRVSALSVKQKWESEIDNWQSTIDNKMGAE